MDFVTNLTRHAVGHCIGRNSSGEVEFTCIAKATYGWDRDGRVTLLDAQPLRDRDEYRGPGENPVLVATSEVMPAKPAVDLLIVGALEFARPTEQVDVGLQLGTRLRKTIRVFGDRTWTASTTASTQSELRPSRPGPISGLPVAWERSFGGTDPEAPGVLEARNPAGLGLRRDPRGLAGTPLPNFENPADLIVSTSSRPAPVGFGAVAAYWQPRAKLAGTYDERWKAERFPLLPADFSAAYFNCAPADQQVPHYVPGEELHLLQMTPEGHERIVLPAFEVPVTFVTREALIDTHTRVDTVIVDPARRELSLLARVVHVPKPNVLALRGMVVGVQSRGVRRALETGKEYLSTRPSARTNPSPAA